MNVLCMNCGRPADFWRACPCAFVSWSKTVADRIRELEAAVAERDEALRVARTMLDEVNTAHARLSTKLAAAEKVVGKAENIRKEWTAKHVMNTPLDLAVVELICQLTTYQAVEAAKGGTKC